MRLAKGNQCSKEDSRNLSGSKSYYQDNCAAESKFFFFFILQQYLVLLCVLSLGFKNNFNLSMRLEMLMFGSRSEFYP